MVNHLFSEEDRSIRICLYRGRSESWSLDRDGNTWESSEGSLDTVADGCCGRDDRPWIEGMECGDSVDDRSRLPYWNTHS